MAIAGHPHHRQLRHKRGPKTHEEKLHGFYVHLIVYLSVNIGLTILNYRRNPEHLWFYWVAAGWGIGIVAHAVRVFVLTGDEPKNLETRAEIDDPSNLS